MVSPIPAGSNISLAGNNIADVYRAYAQFCELAGSLGEVGRHNLARKLILCEPISRAGEAPIIAASIASAASLTIEAVPSAVKQGTHSGAIDFTVNHLDEALRALKNEIRKGLSIAVCLEGDREQILLQMAERGVQPDVMCCSNGPGALLAPFLERGARLVHVTKASIAWSALNPDVTDTTWRVSQLPGKWLPMVDTVIAACLPSDDSVRRDWLKRAPRYLDRLLRTERYLPLTEEEMAACSGLLRTRLNDKAWAGLEVHFERGNAQTVIGGETGRG